jgi:hypothetical protein
VNTVVALFNPSDEIVVCPQPVVAKVIKAAQMARAWNLQRDFANALFSIPELLNPFFCEPLNPSNPESPFTPRYTACVLSESTQYIGSRTPKMPKV